MKWERPTTRQQQRALLAAAITMLKDGIAARDWDRPSWVLAGLQLLLVELRNRSPENRGRITADPVTPAKVAEVLGLREAHPGWSQQEIANTANVNVGRVSEILHGKRGQR